MSMWVSNPRTFIEFDGAWVCAQSVEAVVPTPDGMSVIYLAGGDRAVEVDRKPREIIKKLVGRG